MRITFTKGSGKHDRMVIHRGDASESVECPKQGIIPHDMVHHVVESVLQRRGFLGRLRDGEAATFRMEPEAESDGVERLVEVVQGDAWSGGTASADDMLDLYRVTCRARACPPLPVDAGDIGAIRGRIEQLDREWRALAVGESLELQL